MPHYKTIFFDLDHTLWDFETNSSEALRELFDRYELSKQTSSSAHEFCSVFTLINKDLWDQYDRGEIHRDVLRTQRFHRVLTKIGIDDYDLSIRFSADYLEVSPRKGALMPGSVEVLEYLKDKYPMYIITNGFDEVQAVKMQAGGILGYFKKIFSSEVIGHKKPSKEIFHVALAELGLQSKDVIMIGDNLITDIAGARNAGIDYVFYNPTRIVHHEQVDREITSLLELKAML